MSKLVFGSEAFWALYDARPLWASEATSREYYAYLVSVLNE